MSAFLQESYQAMKQQAAGITDTLSQMDQRKRQVLRESSSVVFLGAGDSYAVGEFGKWAFHEAGLQAIALSPLEIERIRLLDSTLVVGITASGRSRSTMKALSYAKKEGATTVALTDNPKGEASTLTDELWLTHSRVQSYNIVPSAPTTSAMAYLLKIAALHESIPHSRLHEDSIRLERAASNIQAWAEGMGEKLAKMIDLERNLFIIGEGPQYVAASLGMMKLNELSLLRAHPVIREEFQHHFNLVVEDGDRAIILGDRITKDTDTKFIDVMKQILHMRAVYLCSPKDLHIESEPGQAIANTMALQFMAHYLIMEHNPEMEWFKLPNAKAFDIY